jgi:hypothetical protein
MTEPADESRVERRATDLLPEEQAAGSDDPELQAEAILAESEERTEHPEETRRESSQTPDVEDTAPAAPADPATDRPTDAGTGTRPS